MSAFDQLEAVQASRDTALADVEINTTTNTTVTAHGITQFAGTLPIFDLTKVGDTPSEYKDVPEAALQIDELVITEVRAFKQHKGGVEAAEARQAAGEDEILQTQMEFTIAAAGAKIGVLDDEGKFLAHPVYNDPTYSFVWSRALEFYVKSPFNVLEDVMEEIRQACLTCPEPFVTSQRTRDRDTPSRRVDDWHLVAAADPRWTIRDQIIARQKTGLQLSNFALTAPRPLDNRQTDGDRQPLPEFENFLRHFEENLYRVTVALAMGESISKAGTLSTAITGVKAPFPLRATCASLVYNELVPGKVIEHPLNLFPPSAQMEATS